MKFVSLMLDWLLCYKKKIQVSPKKKVRSILKQPTYSGTYEK